MKICSLSLGAGARTLTKLFYKKMFIIPIQLASLGDEIPSLLYFLKLRQFALLT